VPLSGTYGVGKNSAAKEITEPGCGWHNVQYCANSWHKPLYSTIWESERHHYSGSRRCNGSYLEELLFWNTKGHVRSRCKQPLPNWRSRSPAVYNTGRAMSTEGKGMEHALVITLWGILFFNLAKSLALLIHFTRNGRVHCLWKVLYEVT
jgi:hypothetical protein